MKRINSGFTLVESLMTLLIVSLCLIIGGQPPKTVGKDADQWLVTFKTRWQNARLTAQSQGRQVTVIFDQTDMLIDGEHISYPKNYSKCVRQQISILPTGYVAPITITLDGSPNIKIIFSLGGGEFRVSKK
ncbi:prepilin-type N-terminal cleavage/methylation domain-containing protein [Leuconostoc pseudomesenteroides]|uniref:prepilin-type N-terminal cleavage/methylation domain-containing protein n=1 Tax=Leuconostoc pseudomesenteroides TaxID=33968 RepID=UPI00403E1E92